MPDKMAVLQIQDLSILKSFCEMWMMWNPRRTGKVALEWQERIKSQALTSCRHHWRRWWYPLTFGWLLFCSCAHTSQPLPTPAICEHFCTSAFMIPFLPSANIRLNKPQPAQWWHLALPMSKTSLGQVRCCRHAVNVFTGWSAPIPGN